MTIDLSNLKKVENLYQICQMKNNSSSPAIILKKYRYDQELMRDCERVPYVIRGGKYEWSVDIRSVTIADYLMTFPCWGEMLLEFDTGNCFGNNYENSLVNSREYFKLFWKKTMKEWRDVKCSGREQKIFLKHINQYKVSPMSVVQAIYSKLDYQIQEFCELFSCGEKEAKAVLRCLGYRNLNIKNVYEKEHSFEQAMFQVCDNAAIGMQDVKQSMSARIRRGKYSIYNGLHHYFENRADKQSVYINNNTERVEPAKGERKKSWETIVYVIVVLALILSGIYGIFLIKEYLDTLVAAGDFVSWQESSSGFYGGMIGAIFSSIATIATTYLVIQRNYKVDYHRERLEVMPVFTAKCYTDDNLERAKKAYKKQKGREMQIESHGIYENGQLLVFKNIGKGIAFHVEIRRYPKESEPHYLNTIEPKTIKGVVYESVKQRKVIIQYNDLYGNQYVQYVYICKQEDEMVVTAEQPELIMRTKRIRYVQ